MYKSQEWNVINDELWEHLQQFREFKNHFRHLVAYELGYYGRGLE